MGLSCSLRDLLGKVLSLIPDREDASILPLPTTCSNLWRTYGRHPPCRAQIHCRRRDPEPQRPSDPSRDKPPITDQTEAITEDHKALLSQHRAEVEISPCPGVRTQSKNISNLPPNNHDNHDKDHFHRLATAMQQATWLP